jgi:hypothetical protein
LDELEYECSEAGNDAVADVAGIIGNTLRNAIEEGHNLLKRRISWKEFCVAIEDAADELELEMQNHSTANSQVRIYLEPGVSVVRQMLQAVDSGNRHEAEAYAGKIANENKRLIKQNS